MHGCIGGEGSDPEECTNEHYDVPFLASWRPDKAVFNPDNYEVWISSRYVHHGDCAATD
jgi:hypothetical protein